MGKKTRIKKNKTKTKAPRTKTHRTYTAVNLQEIRDIAERLGRLIPQQGFRSSFSLKELARERGLMRFLPKKAPNKKEAFYIFIRDVHHEKPRTMKLLVRNILPRAIERRHQHGDPVLEAEANELAEALLKIGIDMREEIAGLKLPTERPTIVPPPPDVKKALESLGLNPALLPQCRKMFLDGHINESVRKALEKFETMIQGIATLPDKIGKDLMGVAFSNNESRIRLNAMSRVEEMNEQEGYRLIAMGMMLWWRNELSHRDVPQLSHHEALGRLLAVSNMLHRLDVRVL